MNNWNRIRHEKATEFTCFICGKDKKAKLITYRDNDTMCNGCYGEIYSKG